MATENISAEKTGELSKGLEIVLANFFTPDLKKKLNAAGKDIISEEFLSNISRYYKTLYELSGYMKAVESPTQSKRFRDLIKNINEFGSLENITILANTTVSLLKELMVLNKSYSNEITHLRTDIESATPVYNEIKRRVLSKLTEGIKNKESLIKTYRKLKSYDHLPGLRPLDPESLLGQKYDRMIEEFNKNTKEYVVLVSNFWSQLTEIRNTEDHKKFIEISSQITEKQKRIDYLVAHRRKLIDKLNFSIERLATYDPFDKEYKALEEGGSVVEVIYSATKTLQKKDNSEQDM